MTHWLVRALATALVASGLASSAEAHDPSAYGGLFRSRNLGETWLNADTGLFLSAALTVAVDPRAPNHLLLGTDSGLLASANGGRSWTVEEQGLIPGPVFAIAFAPDGRGAICVAPSGVFGFADGRWRRAAAPEGAVPARGLVFAGRDRVFLLGRDGLFLSEDRGLSFRRAALPLDRGAQVTSLAAPSPQGEDFLAVVDGKLLASRDAGETWRPETAGFAGGSVDVVVSDIAVADRLWAASGDQIYASDDRGRHWRRVGRPLPEPQTSVRGIGADQSAGILIVTTHRGLYRSGDGGASWVLKEGNLPIHLEAGPLVRDPHDPATFYAVYSLIPYATVWQSAVEGGNLLGRVDGVALAGGGAFLALLLIGGTLLVLRLQRWRQAEPPPSTAGL